MSKCCIGCGNCSYFHRYILGSIIFNIFKYFSLEYCPILKYKKNELVTVLYKYLGFSIFGFLFFIISIKNNKNNKSIYFNTINNTKYSFNI